MRNAMQDESEWGKNVGTAGVPVNSPHEELNRWEQSLYQQFGAKQPMTMSKSHWRDCDWARGQNPVMLPSDAPPEYISCNACLRRRGYIRVIYCDPHLTGWPYKWRNCDKCEYGLDCQTWLRVRGIGGNVVKVLQLLDPDATHPVTWSDIGMVPFQNPDIFFQSKNELDRFALDLYTKYGIQSTESQFTRNRHAPYGGMPEPDRHTLVHQGFPDGRFTKCGIDRSTLEVDVIASLPRSQREITCGACR